MIPTARKIAPPYIPPCLRRKAQAPTQTQMFNQNINSIEELVQIAEHINWNDKQNLTEELITHTPFFLYPFLEKSQDISETTAIRIIRIIEKVEHTESSFLQLVHLVCSGRFKNDNPIIENKLVFLLQRMLTGEYTQSLQADHCQFLLIQTIKPQNLNIDLETLIKHKIFYMNHDMLDAVSELIVKIKKNSHSVIDLFRPHFKRPHADHLKSIPELNSTIAERQKLFDLCLLKVNGTDGMGGKF
jgi:hypothetical protein